MTGEMRWITVPEAADRARCGPKTIYRAVRSGQLRAARIGGRRELRFLESWIDLWLLGEQHHDVQNARGSTDKPSRVSGDANNSDDGDGQRPAVTSILLIGGAP
jgi:excisionase family DNA binding protein